MVSHTVCPTELVRRAALRDSRGQQTRIQAPSEGTYESEFAAAHVERTILVAWGGVGTTFGDGIAVARASVAAEVATCRRTSPLVGGIALGSLFPTVSTEPRLSTRKKACKYCGVDLRTLEYTNQQAPLGQGSLTVQLPSKPGGVIVMLLHDSLSSWRGKSGRARVLRLWRKAESISYGEDRGILAREESREVEGARAREAFWRAWRRSRRNRRAAGLRYSDLTG